MAQELPSSTNLLSQEGQDRYELVYASLKKKFPSEADFKEQCEAAILKVCEWAYEESMDPKLSAEAFHVVVVSLLWEGHSSPGDKEPYIPQFFQMPNLYTGPPATEYLEYRRRRQEAETQLNSPPTVASATIEAPSTGPKTSGRPTEASQSRSPFFLQPLQAQDGMNAPVSASDLKKRNFDGLNENSTPVVKRARHLSRWAEVVDQVASKLRELEPVLADEKTTFHAVFHRLCGIGVNTQWADAYNEYLAHGEHNVWYCMEGILSSGHAGARVGHSPCQRHESSCLQIMHTDAAPTVQRFRTMEQGDYE